MSAPTMHRYPTMSRRSADAVAPGDSLATSSKRLWVGSGGDVTVETHEGQVLTYRSVPAGTYLQVRARKVTKSGTTASDIIAEYE